MFALGRLLVASALLVRGGWSTDPSSSGAGLRGHDRPEPVLLGDRLLQQGGEGDFEIDIAGIFGNSTAGNVELPANSSEAKFLKKVLKMLDAEEEQQDSGAEGEMPGIIGGERSDPSEFPYFVQAEGLECGGTLVAKDVVMSAAHCKGVFGGRVLVGAYRRGTTEGGAQWRDVVSPMQVHPDFDPFLFLNDVMLFKIAPTNLTPVELNFDPDDPAVGVNLTTAGFGYIRNSDFVRPAYLQKVTLQSISNDVCTTLTKYTAGLFGYETSFQPEVMTCTMGVNADASLTGACNGDSGGPLVNADGKQVGIVSWGSQHSDGACGIPIYPDVFTRVSGVGDWVQEAICKLTDDPSALSFTCPDFVCPADTTIFGTSDLKVPSASGGARSFNGFTPVSVTQTPTAGSTLIYGRDTTVKVTATDASGRSISCRWKVTVPAIDVVGAVAVSLPKGKSNPKLKVFQSSQAPGVVRALIGYVDSGSLVGYPTGGEVNARLRAGGFNSTTSLPLTLDAFTDFDFLYLKPRLRFTYQSNLRMLLSAKNVPTRTVLVYFLYGQQTDYIPAF